MEQRKTIDAVSKRIKESVAEVSEAGAIGSTKHAVSLPQAALIIGPDGLARITARAQLSARYEPENIIEAETVPEALNKIEAIKDTCIITMVVNYSGTDLSGKISSLLGEAEVVTVEDSGKIEEALQSV